MNLEVAEKKGVKIASFVNMPGSMITRMSHFKFMSECGPEICVMATKTMVSQMAFGYLLAKTVIGENSDGKSKLKKLAVTIDEYLKTANALAGPENSLHQYTVDAISETTVAEISDEELQLYLSE